MFYELDQNNSGGSFVVDENLCHRLVIEADNEEEAINIAERLGCYWNGCDEGIDCDCCGDRWSTYTHEIDIEKIKEKGYNVGVYDFMNNPEEQWVEKYGKYPRLTEPAWSKKTSARQFSAPIYFETLESYCQFMADEYGWTKPDVRIFYKDGAIKEFFTI
jgi:hypothetical protein